MLHLSVDLNDWDRRTRVIAITHNKIAASSKVIMLPAFPAFSSRDEIVTIESCLEQWIRDHAACAVEFVTGGCMILQQPWQEIL